MITYHHEIEQGTPEWHELRRGVLTSSCISPAIAFIKSKLDARILVQTLEKQIELETDKAKLKSLKLKFAAAKKKDAAMKSAQLDSAHVYEVAAQRITARTEETYLSFDMMRGHTDEILARDLYARHYAPVTQCGFITNNALGFIVGYSPDGLVGEDGLIEIKSAKAKIQVERIVGAVIPQEHYAQVQTGLWVSGRKWCDFESYSNGMKMMVVRAFVDPAYHALIEAAAVAFEAKVNDVIAAYLANSETFHTAEYIEPLTDEINLEP